MQVKHINAIIVAVNFNKQQIERVVTRGQLFFNAQNCTVKVTNSDLE